MAKKDINRILLIYNYDSFSYNLYQYIGEICIRKWGNGSSPISNTRIFTGGSYELRTIRNDEMSVEAIRDYGPGVIIISPGPGRPSDAGVCEEVVKKLGGSVPILGVCLGHQAICEAYGGTITYAKELMHGKQSEVSIDTSSPIFEGLDERVSVARYHSLAADASDLPGCLQVIARTDDGQIMAVSHREYEVYGLQFHPESILTPQGKKMMENFISLAGGDRNM